MASTVKLEVQTTVRQSDPIADQVVNALYFHTDATPGAGDYQALADSVKTKFYAGAGSGGANPFAYFTGSGGVVTA